MANENTKNDMLELAIKTAEEDKKNFDSESLNRFLKIHVMLSHTMSYLKPEVLKSMNHLLDTIADNNATVENVVSDGIKKMYNRSRDKTEYIEYYGKMFDKDWDRIKKLEFKQQRKNPGFELKILTTFLNQNFQLNKIDIEGGKSVKATLVTLDCLALLTFVKSCSTEICQLNVKNLIDIRNFISHADLKEVTPKAYQKCKNLITDFIDQHLNIGITEKQELKKKISNDDKLHKAANLLEIDISNSTNEMPKNKIVNFIKEYYSRKDGTNKSENDCEILKRNIKGLDLLRQCLKDFSDQQLKKKIERVCHNVNDRINAEVSDLEECIVELMNDLNRQFSIKVNDILAKHADYKEIAQKLSSQFKNALNLTILSIWVIIKTFLDDETNLKEFKGILKDLSLKPVTAVVKKGKTAHGTRETQIRSKNTKQNSNDSNKNSFKKWIAVYDSFNKKVEPHELRMLNEWTEDKNIPEDTPEKFKVLYKMFILVSNSKNNQLTDCFVKCVHECDREWFQKQHEVVKEDIEKTLYALVEAVFETFKNNKAEYEDNKINQIIKPEMKQYVDIFIKYHTREKEVESKLAENVGCTNNDNQLKTKEDISDDTELTNIFNNEKNIYTENNPSKLHQRFYSFYSICKEVIKNYSKGKLTKDIVQLFENKDLRIGFIDLKKTFIQYCTFLNDLTEDDLNNFHNKNLIKNKKLIWLPLVHDLLKLIMKTPQDTADWSEDSLTSLNRISTILENYGYKNKLDTKVCRMHMQLWLEKTNIFSELKKRQDLYKNYEPNNNLLFLGYYEKYSDNNLAEIFDYVHNNNHLIACFGSKHESVKRKMRSKVFMNNEELTENEISCFVDEIIKDTLPECLLERLEYIKTIGKIRDQLKEEMCLLNRCKLEFFFAKQIKNKRRTFTATEKLFKRKFVYDIFQRLVRDIKTTEWPYVKLGNKVEFLSKYPELYEKLDKLEVEVHEEMLKRHVYKKDKFNSNDYAQKRKKKEIQNFFIDLKEDPTPVDKIKKRSNDNDHSGPSKKMKTENLEDSVYKDQDLNYEVVSITNKYVNKIYKNSKSNKSNGKTSQKLISWDNINQNFDKHLDITTDDKNIDNFIHLCNNMLNINEIFSSKYIKKQLLNCIKRKICEFYEKFKTELEDLNNFSSPEPVDWEKFVVASQKKMNDLFKNIEDSIKNTLEKCVCKLKENIIKKQK